MEKIREFRPTKSAIQLARNSLILAEREGFEPPVRITVQQISSLPHSTTLPPLRGGADFITGRIDQAATLITSSPPMYGRSAAGTPMLPSAL